MLEPVALALDPTACVVPSPAWKSMLCMTSPSFMSVNSTVYPWSTDTTGPGIVPLKTIALYITPPGCRGLSGAICTSTSSAIIVTLFILPVVPSSSCACALKNSGIGPSMIPAKRIPAAIPAITGLFILGIENCTVIKKHCFFREFFDYHRILAFFYKFLICITDTIQCTPHLQTPGYTFLYVL